MLTNPRRMSPFDGLQYFLSPPKKHQRNKNKKMNSFAKNVLNLFKEK